LISRIGEPNLFSVQNSNYFSFLLLKNSGMFGAVNFWCCWLSLLKMTCMRTR